MYRIISIEPPSDFSVSSRVVLGRGVLGLFDLDIALELPVLECHLGPDSSVGLCWTVFSLDTPRATLMMINVGAIPCTRQPRQSFCSVPRMAIRRGLTHIYLHRDDGQDGLRRVLEGVHDDKHELGDKIERPALDDNGERVPDHVIPAAE